MPDDTTVALTARVPEPLKEEVEDLAEQKGQSKSSTAKELIEAGLEAEYDRPSVPQRIAMRTTTAAVMGISFVFLHLIAQSMPVLTAPLPFGIASTESAAFVANMLLVFSVISIALAVIGLVTLLAIRFSGGTTDPDLVTTAKKQAIALLIGGRSDVD